MEEVIAKRKNSLGIGFISMSVIGVVLGAVCLGIGITQDLLGAIVLGLSVGLIFTGVGVWMAVKFYKSPKNIIVYRDGVLTLGDKATCSPLDIAGCKIIVTRRNGVVDRWGKVEITLNDGRKYTLDYVDYVESVQQRLSELKEECYNNLMKQYAEEEAAAAESSNYSENKEENQEDNPFDI